MENDCIKKIGIPFQINNSAIPSAKNWTPYDSNKQLSVKW